MDTSNKIINLLNRSPRTISDLADELSLSRNSVHQRVTKLEASGVLEKVMPAHPVGAGKPAYQYRTVGGREDSFSTAYKPLLDVLVQTLGEDLPAARRLEVFRKTGRSMATSAGLTDTGDLKGDLDRSLQAVNALGAMAELSCQGKDDFVSCYSCPVASLVHSEPMTCEIVGAFFSEATGREVSVQCERQRNVVCGFQFGPKRAD